MKIKNLVIGLAIMILASFVAIYGIKAFYGEEPQWDAYCGKIVSPPYVNSSAQCENLGGKWTNYNQIYEGAAPAKVYPDGQIGYCDLFYNCQKEFENASRDYSKTLFIITVPVGVVLIAVGGALFALEAVGVGIMLGGVITLIYGAANYWPNANNIFRFLISLAGLIIVIALAYWLNKKDFFKNLIKRNAKSKK